MKKLFFFRSSASSNGSNQSSPSSEEKQSTDKNRTKNQTSCSSPSLRRSRTYSSGIFHEGGLGEKNSSSLNSQYGSPSSGKGSQDKSKHRAACCRTLTPERKSGGKWFEDVVQNSHGLGKPEGVVSSGASFGSSESSSNCSSNVSSKVLDRYIDGEELLISSAQNNPPFQRTQVGYGNGGVKRPPRVLYTAPAAIDGEQKPRSQSFRETKASKDYFSMRDWVENGFEHESPRKLAKHVIERLSQSCTLAEVGSKELNTDVPITIEDIYGGPLSRPPSLHSDGNHRQMFSLSEINHLSGEKHRDLNSAGSAEDTDVDLLERSKEAEERAMFLSNELEQETYIHGSGFNVSGLVQTIKSLAEERFNLALEVSSVLKDQVVERASAKEELRLSILELDSRTRRLEKEKDELRTSLEKELDRRSTEWSFKLEKYQAEEHILRDRVRQLAEQNVTLQTEVSSLRERTSDSRIQMTSLEQQMHDLNERLEEERTQNHYLQQNISEIQEKYAATEEERECIRKNYNEKENECKELHRCITRMLRTCNEQDKTIDGLREGLGKEFKKQNSPENFDRKLGKLKMELMRLTGVEQALRKEVESYKHEVDSLQQENINILHRLEGSKEGGSLFKIDQELRNRVCCLQNQGPKLLNESIQFCYKLLEHIKEKSGYSSDVKQGFEATKNGLDGQFVVESDMKLQGFKRGAENLIQSLQTVSSVLQEKVSIVESQSHGLRDGSSQPNDYHLEDKIRSELKAEILLTSLLRENLYSKELDMEQLQAELAAAVRGNDILRCELQNALDTLSCVTHKIKGLELQMINKDESINRLENDLQECTKDLTIVRGILPKVSEERDLMWDEVKQYSEKNMLLNCEVNVLKKKVEALDEDILIKEGQITILKDSLGNKPFDILLASTDSTREFLPE